MVGVRQRRLWTLLACHRAVVAPLALLSAALLMVSTALPLSLIDAVKDHGGAPCILPSTEYGPLQ